MNELIGIGNLKSLATAMGQLVTLGYGFFVEKTGIWPIIGGFKAPSTVLTDFFADPIRLAAAKAEVMDLSESEMKELNDALLAPMPQALKDKLGPVDGVLLQVVAIIEKAVIVGKTMYADVTQVIAEVKALVS